MYHFTLYTRFPLTTQRHASQTASFTTVYFFFFSNVLQTSLRAYGRNGSGGGADRKGSREREAPPGAAESPPSPTIQSGTIAPEAASAYFMGNAFHHRTFILFRDLLRQRITGARRRITNIRRDGVCINVRA